MLPKFVQGGTRHHLRAHHGWAHGFANFLLKYSSNDIKLGNPPKEMVLSTNYIDLSLSTYILRQYFFKKHSKSMIEDPTTNQILSFSKPNLGA